MTKRGAVFFLAVLIMVLPCLLIGAEVQIGTKKGISFGSVYGFDSEGDETRGLLLGFNGGVFVGISLNRWLSLQPEILFNQRGITERVDDFDMEWSWIATYFDIPILAKVNLSFLRDLLRASVYLGPQFSFNVSTLYHQEGSPNGGDDAPDAEPFDLGLVMGAEGGVHFLSYYVFLDFRYVLGFVPMVNPTETDGQLVRNSTFSFLLGFAFTI